MTHERLSDAILIIGPREDFLRAFTTAFEAQGALVIRAQYEATAWLLAASLRPRAVLCELRLKGGGCASLARRIRRTSWGAGVKLIVLAPTLDPGMSETLRRSGFDACFLKSSFDYIAFDKV